MRIERPYHEGELLVQQRAGELARGERNGAVISTAIMKGAIPFLARQRMVVLGSVDRRGRVWASMLFGPPGFVSAPDGGTVALDLGESAPAPGDPAWSNLRADPRVGLLVIDLASRRRVRINGRVAELGPHRARIEVDEAYPNCPKYIQRRNLGTDGSDRAGATRATRGTRRGTVLEPELRALLVEADTLFVASAHPERGVDASHRGGNPGFVRVEGSRLRIPDYRGNSMFNTLGNFAVHPQAGLAVPDFETGRCLQIIGHPELHFDSEDPHNETGGTRRFWDLHVQEWILTGMPATLQWEFLDRSPHNPLPGGKRGKAPAGSPRQLLGVDRQP